MWRCITKKSRKSHSLTSLVQHHHIKFNTHCLSAGLSPSSRQSTLPLTPPAEHTHTNLADKWSAMVGLSENWQHQTSPRMQLQHCYRIYFNDVGVTQYSLKIIIQKPKQKKRKNRKGYLLSILCQLSGRLGGRICGESKRSKSRLPKEAAKGNLLQLI